jgi:hypothetical protein
VSADMMHIDEDDLFAPVEGIISALRRRPARQAGSAMWSRQA